MSAPAFSIADRNCISNIHPPGGLGYQQAARVVAGLVDGARSLGQSGVKLKDTFAHRRARSGRRFGARLTVLGPVPGQNQRSRTCATPSS